MNTKKLHLSQSFSISFDFSTCWRLLLLNVVLGFSISKANIFLKKEHASLETWARDGNQLNYIQTTTQAIRLVFLQHPFGRSNGEYESFIFLQKEPQRRRPSWKSKKLPQNVWRNITMRRSIKSTYRTIRDPILTSQTSSKTSVGTLAASKLNVAFWTIFFNRTSTPP